MPTFVYNPGIQVYIETTDKRTQKTRILDVSDDLISGSITRVQSGVSSMNLTLQNSGRKYDYPHPLFMPNDRIIVNMKRITWMRVFTGYLNQVPVFAAWPGPITLTASCSLKRLQYFYWDPTVPQSYGMLDKAIQSAQNSSTADGVFSAMCMAILDQVVGWPKDRVHLGHIPRDVFDFMLPLAKEVQQDAASAQAWAAQMAQQVGANATVAGQSVPAGGPTGPVVGTSILDGEPVPATSGKISDFGGTPSNPPVDHSTIGRSFANGVPVTSGDPYYCAMRWQYSGGPSNAKPSSWFYGSPPGADTAKKLIVTNQRTGKVVVVYAADWGPSQSTGRVLDLDPRAMKALGGVTDDVCSIAWAQDQTVAPGPVTGNEGYATPGDSHGDPTNTTGNSNPTSSKSNSKAAPTRVGNTTVTTDDCRSFLNNMVQLVEQHTIKYDEVSAAGYLSNLSKNPPPILDCSAFVMCAVLRCFGTLTPPGAKSAIPRTVAEQYAWAKRNGATFVKAEQAMKIPGCIVYIGDLNHTEISMGDGQNCVGAHNSVDGVDVRPVSASYWAGGWLMPGVQYTDSNGNQITGGIDPTQIPTNGGGSGNDPTNTDPWLQNHTEPAGNNDFDQIFNSSGSYISVVDTSGLQYTGALALYNDTPVFNYIDTLIHASLRQWCSAPNGDIMSWFPDYFGVWGTAAVMTIEDIELQDFQVSWSDEALVTHEFVTGTIDSISFDNNTGNVGGTPDPVLSTSGIASIDMKSLFNAMLGAKMTPADEMAFQEYIYKRFGARPKAEQFVGITGTNGNHTAEFFMAVFQFMRYWANQYTAQIPVTFMPEIWPGMLVRLPNYGFQAYVEQVQHDFTLGKGGSFNTTVTVSSPTSVGKNPLLFGLPAMPQFSSSAKYTDLTDAANTLKHVGNALRKLVTSVEDLL